MSFRKCEKLMAPSTRKTVRCGLPIELLAVSMFLTLFCMIHYKRIAVVNAVSNTVRTFLDRQHDTMDKSALPLLVAVLKIYTVRHLSSYRSRTPGRLSS